MCDCIFNESCEYLVELALHHQKALNKIILLMLLSARNCVSVAAKGRCCTLCLAPAFLSYLKLFYSTWSSCPLFQPREMSETAKRLKALPLAGGSHPSSFKVTLCCTSGGPAVVLQPRRGGERAKQTFTSSSSALGYPPAPRPLPHPQHLSSAVRLSGARGGGC